MTDPCVHRVLPRPSSLLRPCAFFVLLALLLASVRAADPTGLFLTGSVSNAATGNLLEGASVEIPRLGLATLADNTGHYVFANVPAGEHEVVVSYIGLDSVRRQVTISPGQRAEQNFDLTTGIYKMDQFKVTGEREGDAAAITAHRNAENLKNVAATDSFGNLPNMNAGEVAIRLPGIYGELDAGGNLSGFTVRGMPSGLNMVTMDGGLMTGQSGATSRGIFVNHLTAGMYEQVELIKGHTPDHGADSLGGTINFKTRSPLGMREKRRFTYTLSARTAPSFTQQIPLREERRTHGLANLSYQEVFDTMSGQRNLGVVLNLFNSETAIGSFFTQRDFQNTTTEPAYLWDYRTSDLYNHRRQKTVNTKVDYRFSPDTKLSFGATYVDHSEVFRRLYETRAYTGSQTQNTVPSATTSIVPGYTDRITVVRPVATSTIDMTMTGPNNFFNRLRKIEGGAEHTWGPWQVDYNASYTQTHINIGNGEGGVLINRLTGAGWILDRTQSDLYPKFIQNGGPDFTDPNNYRPAPNGLSNDNNKQIQEVTEGRTEVRYTPLITMPVVTKAGLHWREQHIGLRSASRRWNYIGTGPLPADSSLLTMDKRKTGRNIPQWEASWFIHGREVADPALWREDLYFRETTKYTGFSDVTETVTAPFVMAQGKLGRDGWLGRTGFLGGVRWEKTENAAFGWVRARTLSSAALQASDPVGSAQHDYLNNRRDIDGSYTKSFPSIHAYHDITPNLKARLSWSTSFARPRFGNLSPSETPNEANKTLTINNPSLLPQTAKNWDASLEYYFEPVGNFSVGWFHKEIRDYIVNGIDSGTIGTGADNGYNGEYPGWTILTSANAGTAIVQGWEFNYQQQFTFLPGVLKGLSGLINYTVLDTHGNFGGTTGLTTGQVGGFVPRTANASLTWRYRAFSTRLLVNYASTFLQTYGGASPARNLYRLERTLINLGFSYQLRPSVTLTLDIDNLTNVPQKRYRGVPNNVEYYNYPGITFTAGVSGRF